MNNKCTFKIIYRNIKKMNAIKQVRLEKRKEEKGAGKSRKKCEKREKKIVQKQKD